MSSPTLAASQRPFEIRNVVPASNPAAAGRLVEEFAHTDLPVIAIEDTGRTLSVALKAIGPLLPEAMETGVPSSEFRIPLGDSLWHFLPGIDLPPLPDDWHIDPHGDADSWITINYHHTGFGEVQGRFVRALRPFSYLHDKDKYLLGQGVVDTRNFEPVCWRSLSKRGTLVIFKAGLPLAHSFSTLKRPRGSTLQIARLALATQE